MKKHDDVFLHKISRHTNLQLPFSDYVKVDKFPAQISDLLGTVITLKYRNYYRSELEAGTKSATIIRDGEKVSSRPSDDTQQLEDREPLSYEIDETPFYYEDPFIILRADAEEPFRLIAVSTDYTKMVVNSTEIVNGDYLFFTKVSEYHPQMNEFIGIDWKDQYAGIIPELRAISLRVDETEPCYSILMEYLEEDMVRFVLGDETMAKMADYKRKDDWGERLYSNILNDYEVAELRRSVIEGKTIYGAS